MDFFGLTLEDFSTLNVTLMAVFSEPMYGEITLKSLSHVFAKLK